ncbi:MAG: hypothetical protein WCB67_14770 [Solirubrobacteraceae bacterium]
MVESIALAAIVVLVIAGLWWTRKAGGPPMFDAASRDVDTRFGLDHDDAPPISDEHR